MTVRLLVADDHEVIRKGLAKTNRNAELPNLDLGPFIEAEKVAKSERKGIWALPPKKKKAGLVPALLLLGICGEQRK